MLGSIIENYLESIKSQKSPDYYRFSYTHSMQVLLTMNSIGVFSENQIDVSIMHKFVSICKNNGNCNNTINKKIGVLKRVLSYNKTIIDGVSNYPKLTFKRRSFRIVDDSDLSKALTYFRSLDDSPCNLQKKIMFFFFLYTGARLTEILNIKIENINFKYHSILLEHTKTGDPRHVFFNPLEDPQFDNQIKKYISLNQREYLFWNFRKNINRRFETNHVEAMFLYAKKKLGLVTFRPHNLRHTMATLLVENGASIKSIQDLLGHKNISTTEIYLHMSISHIKREYDNCFPKL